MNNTFNLLGTSLCIPWWWCLGLSTQRPSLFSTNGDKQDPQWEEPALQNCRPFWAHTRWWHRRFTGSGGEKEEWKSFISFWRHKLKSLRNINPSMRSVLKNVRTVWKLNEQIKGSKKQCNILPSDTSYGTKYTSDTARLGKGQLSLPWVTSKLDSLTS